MRHNYVQSEFFINENLYFSIKKKAGGFATGPVYRENAGYYCSRAPVKMGSDALMTAVSLKRSASIFPKYFGNSIPR